MGLLITSPNIISTKVQALPENASQSTSGCFSHITGIMNSVAESRVVATVKGWCASAGRSLQSFFSKLTACFSGSAGVTDSDRVVSAPFSKKADTVILPLKDIQYLCDVMNKNIDDPEKNIEGIFRISGNAQHIKQLEQDFLEEISNISCGLHEAAGEFKKQLRVLCNPENDQPLLDMQTVSGIIGSEQDPVNAVKLLKGKIEGLPDGERKNKLNTIMDFIGGLPQRPGFLERSSMTNNNLAICLAPNLVPDNVTPQCISPFNQAFAVILANWSASADNKTITSESSTRFIDSSSDNDSGYMTDSSIVSLSSLPDPDNDIYSQHVDNVKDEESKREQSRFSAYYPNNGKNLKWDKEAVSAQPLIRNKFASEQPVSSINPPVISPQNEIDVLHKEVLATANELKEMNLMNIKNYRVKV